MVSLKQWLNANKVPIGVFARRHKVTPECVRLWYRGDRFPTAKHLVSIIKDTKGEVTPLDFLRINK